MHDLCALVGPKEYLENIMTKIIQIILEKRFATVKRRFPKSCGYPKSSMSGDYDSVLKTMVIWESTHPKMWTTQSSFINVYPHRPHIAPKPYTVDDGLVPYRW